MTQQDDGSGTSGTGFGGEPTREQSSAGGWDEDALDEDSVTAAVADEEDVVVGSAWSAEADAATPQAADAWAASADAAPAPGSDPDPR